MTYSLGMDIEFRPHHVICTLGFRGKGYSPGFVQNYWDIIERLEKEDSEIEITVETDSICAPCPHNQTGICDKNEKIRVLDTNHSQELGLENGARLRWSEAKQLIRDRLSLDRFHQMCASCSWKKLGFCESALRDLGVK